MNILLFPLDWLLRGVLEIGRLEAIYADTSHASDFGASGQAGDFEQWGRARRALEYPDASCHCLKCYHAILRAERDE